MPKPIALRFLNRAELLKSLGKPKTFSVNFPKRAVSTAELRSALKSWQSRQAPPAMPSPKDSGITAVRLRAADVTKLRAVVESSAPTAEAIVGQKMGPDQLLGTLYSALTVLEFTKMEGEYKKRLAKASPVLRKRVDADWNNVVKAAQTAYSAAGLDGLTENDLRSFAQELGRSRANFTATTNISNTGKAVAGQTDAALTARSTAVGAFVAEVGVLLDPEIVTTTIEGLCDKPFAEGVFTKHFSKSFELKVRLRVWCPTWTNPFRTCMKTFTLAGVTFSVNVEVGYRVTCCGATAWGQARAEACASVVGIRVCAGCSATITGVAGIGRSGSGNRCTYGIGVNAQLTCEFAGVTIFNVQAPFGFNVLGPCPPAGLC